MIRVVFDWGVEVWVPDRSYERELWYWSMIRFRVSHTFEKPIEQAYTVTDSR